MLEWMAVALALYMSGRTHRTWEEEVNWLRSEDLNSLVILYPRAGDIFTR